MATNWQTAELLEEPAGCPTSGGAALASSTGMSCWEGRLRSIACKGTSNASLIPEASVSFRLRLGRGVGCPSQGPVNYSSTGSSSEESLAMAS